MEFDDKDDDAAQIDSDMDQETPETEDAGDEEGGEDLEDFGAEAPDDGSGADTEPGADDLEGFSTEDQTMEADDESGTNDLEDFEAMPEADEACLRDPTLTAEQLAQIEEMEQTGEMDEQFQEYSTISHRLVGEELTEEPINVDMPYYDNGKYPVGALREHAADQEYMINSKTVAEFLDACEARRENGRSPESAEVQKEYREGLRETLVDDLMTRDPELTEDDARIQAVEMMRGGAALHSPDQIAGGDPTDVYSFGPRSINSAMGALWGRDRADALYERVKELSRDMSREEMEQTYMNVHLDLHPRT